MKSVVFLHGFILNRVCKGMFPYNDRSTPPLVPIIMNKTTRIRNAGN
jgi:hypothetical protein